MNSMLYSSKTIETKYFLLSNLKIKKKFGGFVRTQEFGCSNYYGEEIKNPIYETNIKPTGTISKNIIIKPINLFNHNIKNKLSNKSVSLRESCKILLKPKDNMGFQAKVRQNHSSKRKNNLNIIKIIFPYCKPTVQNSYTKLFVYNKNKDYIVAKEIEKNKKKL